MRKSYLFVALFVGLIAIVFGIYFPVLTKYRNLKMEEEALDQKITEVDKKIQALMEERELLKNDRDYIEKVIRQELGLVKPGEIIYKFVTDPPKPKTPSPSLAEVVEEPIGGVAGSKPVLQPPAKEASKKST